MRGGRRPVGRPVTPNGVLARELNMDIKVVQRMGGAEKINAMSPEARALMLGIARKAGPVLCRTKEQNDAA